MDRLGRRLWTGADDGGLLVVGASGAAAPGVPAGALPSPAALQSAEAWVLPDLAGDGWVVLTPGSRRPSCRRPRKRDRSSWPTTPRTGRATRAAHALREAGATRDRVVNFALQLNADGSITTRPYPDLSAAAGEMGVPVYGLVYNMENGHFSAEIARAVLSDPERRGRAVADMLAIVQVHGLAGIDIDIENVPGDLRPHYTALVREAAAALKPRDGIHLTVSVPAKVWDDTTSNWGGAFDYAALGEAADQVAIMTYDEHTYGLPHGPVALAALGRPRRPRTPLPRSRRRRSCWGYRPTATTGSTARGRW